MKKVLFVLPVLFVGIMVAHAQKYGGSAYVQVKDNKGNTRTINATTICYYSSESAAKSELHSDLRRQSHIHEEFNNEIYYSIDKCYADDKKKYGGSAFVKVADSKGNIRSLNATTICYYSSASAAKSELHSDLRRQSHIHEDFVSGISYDIDRCD